MKRYKKKRPKVLIKPIPFSSGAELGAFAEKLGAMNRQDALQYGAEKGFNMTVVDVLRSVIGATVKKKSLMSETVRKEILAKAAEGAFPSDLAKEYDVNLQQLCQFLRRRDCLNHKNDYWTEIKVRKICTLLFNKKSDKENADIMGIKTNAFKMMKKRLLTKKDCKKWIPIAEKMGIYNHA